MCAPTSTRAWMSSSTGSARLVSTAASARAARTCLHSTCIYLAPEGSKNWDEETLLGAEGCEDRFLVGHWTWRGASDMMEILVGESAGDEGIAGDRESETAAHDGQRHQDLEQLAEMLGDRAATARDSFGDALLMGRWEPYEAGLHAWTEMGTGEGLCGHGPPPRPTTTA